MALGPLPPAGGGVPPSGGGAVRGGGSFAAGAAPPPGLEGGATHRRLFAWRPTSAHINTLLQEAGPTTVARARWLARNNGYARAAMRAWRAATVGTGIKPSSMIPDEATRTAVNLAWRDWSEEADAEGVTNLAGIMRRVAGEAFLAGECFIRFRPRRPEDGLSVPLQLQVMPSEQLPMDRQGDAPDGGNVRMGIEFHRNLKERREAYWFYRQDPSDKTRSYRDALGKGLLTRVPASEVIHVYDPGEAGQIRGVSNFASGMVRLFHLDLYDDAEIERKKQAARHAAVITTTEDTDVSDGELPPIAPYGPGAYMVLNPGEDIKFTEPAEVGGSYEPFQYRTLAAISAGFGIPYGEISHDLTKANYASSRAGLVAFRLEVEAFQRAVLIFQMLRRVWAEWLKAAVLVGAVPIRASDYLNTPAIFNRAKYVTPKLPWVDPAKDARGEEIMVNNGWKSRSDVIESLGNDPEETDLRIAMDRDRAERFGLSFPLGAKAAPNAEAPGAKDDDTPEESTEGDKGRPGEGKEDAA